MHVYVCLRASLYGLCTEYIYMIIRRGELVLAAYIINIPSSPHIWDPITVSPGVCGDKHGIFKDFSPVQIPLLKSSFVALKGKTCEILQTLNQSEYTLKVSTNQKRLYSIRPIREGKLEFRPMRGLFLTGYIKGELRGGRRTSCFTLRSSSH